MYDRNVKSERILTKLRVLDYEYIADRIVKFHKKILFITRVSSIELHTAVRQTLRRPAHRARETVHPLTHETPDFITPTLWPANSPDLNSVDYQIWWKLQDRVYRSQIRDLKSRRRLLEEWEHFLQVVIDKAARQWRPRVGACVRLWAHGGHFEHKL